MTLDKKLIQKTYNEDNPKNTYTVFSNDYVGDIQQMTFLDKTVSIKHSNGDTNDIPLDSITGDRICSYIDNDHMLMSSNNIDGIFNLTSIDDNNYIIGDYDNPHKIIGKYCYFQNDHILYYYNSIKVHMSSNEILFQPIKNGCLIYETGKSNLLYFNEDNKTVNIIYTNIFEIDMFQPVDGGCLIPHDNGLLYYNYKTKNFTALLTTGKKYVNYQSVIGGYLFSSTDPSVTGIFFFNNDTISVEKVYSTDYNWATFISVENGCLIGCNNEESVDSGIVLFNTSTKTCTKIHRNGCCINTKTNIKIGAIFSITYPEDIRGIYYYTNELKTCTRIIPEVVDAVYCEIGDACLICSQISYLGVCLFKYADLSISKIYNSGNWELHHPVNGGCLLSNTTEVGLLFYDASTNVCEMLKETFPSIENHGWTPELCYDKFYKVDGAVFIHALTGFAYYNESTRKLIASYTDSSYYDTITKLEELYIITSSMYPDQMLYYNPTTEFLSNTLYVYNSTPDYTKIDNLVIINSANPEHTICIDILTDKQCTILVNSDIKIITNNHDIFIIDIDKKFVSKIYTSEEERYYSTYIALDDGCFLSDSGSGLLIYVDYISTTYKIIYSTGMYQSPFIQPVDKGWLVFNTQVNGITFFSSDTKTSEIIFEGNGIWSKCFPVDNGVILSGSSGVAFYDMYTKTCTLLSNEIGLWTAVHFIDDGALISATTGIAFYNSHLNTCTKIHTISYACPYCITTANGYLLSSSSASYRGLLLVNRNDKTVTQIYSTGHSWSTFIKTPEGLLIFGAIIGTTNGYGVLYYDEPTSTVTHIGGSSVYSTRTELTKGSLFIMKSSSTYIIHYFSYETKTSKQLWSGNWYPSLFNKISGGLLLTGYTSGYGILYFNETEQTLTSVYGTGYGWRIGLTIEGVYLLHGNSSSIYGIILFDLETKTCSHYMAAYNNISGFVSTSNGILVLRSSYLMQELTLFDEDTKTFVDIPNSNMTYCKLLHTFNHHYLFTDASKFVVYNELLKVVEYTIDVDSVTLSELIHTTDSGVLMCGYSAGVWYFDYETKNIRKVYASQDYSWTFDHIDNNNIILVSSTSVKISFDLSSKRVMATDFSHVTTPIYEDVLTNTLYGVDHANVSIDKVFSLGKGWRYFGHGYNDGYIVAGADDNTNVLLLEDNFTNSSVVIDVPGIIQWENTERGTLFSTATKSYYYRLQDNTIVELDKYIGEYNVISLNDNGLVRICKASNLTTGYIFDEDHLFLFEGNCTNKGAARMRSDGTYVSLDSGGTFWINGTEKVYVDTVIKTTIAVTPTEKGCVILYGVSTSAYLGVFYFSNVRKNLLRVYATGIFHNTIVDGNITIISSTLSSYPYIILFDDETEIATLAYSGNYAFGLEYVYPVNDGYLISDHVTSSSSYTSGVLLYNKYDKTITRIYSGTGKNWDTIEYCGDEVLLTSSTMHPRIVMIYSNSSKTAKSVTLTRDIIYVYFKDDFLFGRYTNLEYFVYKITEAYTLVNFFEEDSKLLFRSVLSSRSFGVILLDTSKTGIGMFVHLYDKGFSWTIGQPVSNGYLLYNTGNNVDNYGILYLNMNNNTITKVYETGYSWNNYQPVKDGCLIWTTVTSSNILRFNEKTLSCVEVQIADGVASAWRIGLLNNSKILIYSTNSGTTGLYSLELSDSSVVKIIDYGYNWNIYHPVIGGYLIMSNLLTTVNKGIFYYNSSNDEITILDNVQFCCEIAFAENSHVLIYSSYSSAYTYLAIMDYNEVTKQLTTLLTNTRRWSLVYKVKDGYLLSSTTNNGIIYYNTKTFEWDYKFETGLNWTGVSINNDGYLFYSSNSASLGVLYYNPIDETLVKLYSLGYNWRPLITLDDCIVLTSTNNSSLGILRFNIHLKSIDVIHDTGYSFTLYDATPKGWIIWAGIATTPGLYLFNKETKDLTCLIDTGYGSRYCYNVFDELFICGGSLTSAGILLVDVVNEQVTELLTTGYGSRVFYEIDTGCFIWSTISTVPGLYFFNKNTKKLTCVMENGYGNNMTVVAVADGYLLHNISSSTTTRPGIVYFINDNDFIIYNEGYYWNLRIAMNDTMIGIYSSAANTLGYLYLDLKDNTFHKLLDYGLYWNSIVPIENGYIISSINSANHNMVYFDINDKSIVEFNTGKYGGKQVVEFEKILFIYSSGSTAMTGVYYYNKINKEFGVLIDDASSSSSRYFIETRIGYFVYGGSTTTPKPSFYNIIKSTVTQLGTNTGSISLTNIGNDTFIATPATTGVWYFNDTEDDLFQIINTGSGVRNYIEIENGYIIYGTASSNTGTYYFNKITKESKLLMPEMYLCIPIKIDGGYLIYGVTSTTQFKIIYIDSNGDNVKTLISSTGYSTVVRHQLIDNGCIIYTTSSNITGLFLYDNITKTITNTITTGYGERIFQEVSGGYIIYSTSSNAPGVIYYNNDIKTFKQLSTTGYGIRTFQEVADGYIMFGSTSNSAGLYFYDPVLKDLMLVDSLFYGTKSLVAIKNGWLLIGTASNNTGIWFYNNHERSIITIKNTGYNWVVLHNDEDHHVIGSASTNGSFCFNSFTKTIIDISSSLSPNAYGLTNGCLVTGKETTASPLYYINFITGIVETIYSNNFILANGMIDYGSGLFLTCGNNSSYGVKHYDDTTQTFSNLNSVGYSWRFVKIANKVFIFPSNGSTPGLYSYDIDTAVFKNIYSEGYHYRTINFSDSIIFASSVASVGLLLYNASDDTFTVLMPSFTDMVYVDIPNGVIISSSSSKRGISVYNKYTQEFKIIDQIDALRYNIFYPVDDGVLIISASDANSGIWFYDNISDTFTQIYDVGYNYSKVIYVDNGVILSSASIFNPTHNNRLLFYNNQTKKIEIIYENFIASSYNTGIDSGILISSSETFQSGLIYYDYQSGKFSILHDKGYMWGSFQVELPDGWLLSSNSSTSQGLLFFDKITKNCKLISEYGTQLNSKVEIDIGYFIYSTTSSTICGCIYVDKMTKRGIDFQGTSRNLNVLTQFDNYVFIRSSISTGFLYFNKVNRTGRLFDDVVSYNYNVIIEVSTGFFISSSSTTFRNLYYFDKSTCEIDLIFESGFNYTGYHPTTNGYFLYGHLSNAYGILYYDLITKKAYPIYIEGYSWTYFNRQDNLVAIKSGNSTYKQILNVDMSNISVNVYDHGYMWIDDYRRDTEIITYNAINYTADTLANLR